MSRKIVFAMNITQFKKSPQLKQSCIPLKGECQRILYTYPFIAPRGLTYLINNDHKLKIALLISKHLSVFCYQSPSTQRAFLGYTEYGQLKKDKWRDILGHADRCWISICKSLNVSSYVFFGSPYVFFGSPYVRSFKGYKGILWHFPFNSICS